jgi:isopentenyl-diphosphate Delta-isomerase
MNTDQQLLLLVDENDIFSGEYAFRKLCHTGKGLHHRAFVVLLENTKGQVLLQKRKHVLWDKHWDITATTHVLHLKEHDESYDEAGQRVLLSEMGISNVPLQNSGGFNYYAKHDSMCENEYCAILIGNYTGIVTPNPEVVYDYAWVEKKIFLGKCLSNDPSYTPWALLTGKFLAHV